MIIHYKDDISNYKLEFQRELQYTSEYSFIPLKIKHDSSNQESYLFQTPLLFSPYGIQTQENKKRTIDVSFMNKHNDSNLSQFLKSLQTIYKIVSKKYSKRYRVNTFLKDTIFNECLRIKVNQDLLIYDQNKNLISDISSFSYGWFLINLHGLWRSDKELWFQWYLVQAKIIEPLRIQTYLFLDDEEHQRYTDPTDPDDPNDPNEVSKHDNVIKDDKYSKMLKMGVPQEAIDLQRRIDLQKRIDSSKSIPPPPPLLNHALTRPSMRSFANEPPQKITASDLKQVVLKKPKHINKDKLRASDDQMGFFEPPSLDAIQTMLKNLKSIK